MENVGIGAFLEGEWESLSNMFTAEELNFGDQFLNNPTNLSLVASLNDCNEYFCCDPNNSLSEFHSDNVSDTTSYNNPLQFLSNSYQNCQFPMSHDVCLPRKFSVMDQTNLSPVGASSSTTVNVDRYNSSQLGSVEDNGSNNLGSAHGPEGKVKHKCCTPQVQAQPKLKAVPKRKAQVSNERGKKSIKKTNNAQANQSNASEGENSDSDSRAYYQDSDGEMAASRDLVSETSNGKKRASRGTATDPQSLYARKRRERINERLRILQNLVPNGTKVDISTMLEEAVHYVKFLQLQIQLLSSDELWMYAPIAYNGVDINLYKRISPFLLS